jgi:urease accessory protein
MTTDTNLLNLMTWLSPSFPVCGYVYSHGIEYAVEMERVTDELELTNWIKAALGQGAGRVDGAFFVATWQAFTDNDKERLIWMVERADIQRGSSEMALESSAQGQAFIDTILQTQDLPGIKNFAELVKIEQRDMSYAIAISVVSASAEIPLREALLAYYHAFAANLISAGVRLVPLGQIAGQRCMEALKPFITETVEFALAGSFDDLGTAAPLIDWASMKHETQYTRLFRS